MIGQSTSRAGHGARAAWIGVGAPIFALVLVIIVLAVATFAGFAAEQDRTFERSSERLVASAIDGRASSLAGLTLDYANWDDAYDAVARWNQRWINANFSSSVADAMLIVRANGVVRQAWFADEHWPARADVQAAAVRAAIATPGLRRLVRAPDAAGTVSRTYAHAGDQLVIVTLAPFTRVDDAARLAQPAQNQDFLVLVDVATAAELHEMGAALDLDELRFTGGAPERDFIGLPISASTGAPVGALAWRHEHPGAATFLARVWPVIFGLLFIGGLTALIARLVVARQIAAYSHASAALESSQAKSEFLARVSHELRTPLNAIVGYAELIEEESEIKETQVDASRIVTAARQLGHLINDIIDQSRIDAGRMKFNLEPLPVAGMVAEIQGLIGHTARTSRVAFAASTDPAASFVFADHVRLRQCLLNMLGNAIKFAPNGTVSLRATLDRSGAVPMVLFTVQDNGIGMTKSEIEEIFRPFGQANPDISKKYGGTGLGLSIADELARAMGGSISVTSEPGEGSTFVLAIPAATAAALKAA